MNTYPTTRRPLVQTILPPRRFFGPKRQFLASGGRALWLAFAMGLGLQTAAGAATDPVDFAIADPSFSSVLALETRVPNPDVRRLIVQPDGKIVVAGGMQVTANPRQAALLRQNSDGTIDEAFAPAIEFDEGGKPGLASVDVVVLQPDGGLVVGGRFTSVNGVARPGLARVRSDGSHDDTFDPGAGSPLALALQADGRILVGGAFNNFRGEPRRPLARLEQNGAYDRTFVAALPGDSYVSAVAVQQDGNILVSVTSNSSAVGKGVIRLKPDGSQDGSFDTGLGVVNRFKAGWVTTIHPLPDGKAYVAGSFTAVNGQPRRGLARLQSNGSVDPSFVPQGIPVDQEGTAWVTALAVQSDGKPLISWYPLSSPAVLVRLMTDGAPDANFLALNGLVPCPDCLGFIWTLALQPDGRILAGGPRGGLTPDGIPRTGVVRLLPSGGTGFDLWQGEVKTSETIGEVAVTVRRRGNTSGTGSVRFLTRDGSARAGEDYEAQAGELTFAPGETSKTVRLRLLDDALMEGLETFQLLLDQPQGGILVGQTIITVTLLSEDVEESVFNFATTEAQANELDGSIRLTVVRSGTVSKGASVQYVLGGLGTAMPGDDFQPVTGRLWFGPGVAESSFDVPVFEDAQFEVDELFTYRLVDPAGEQGMAARVGQFGVTRLRLVGWGSRVEFARSEHAFRESDGFATIQVRRRGETNEAFTVRYRTLEGSARPGVHYLEQDGTLSFAEGQVSATFNVPLLDTAAVDGTRQAKLSLSDPTGTVQLPGSPFATLTILDDERPAALDPTFDSPLAFGSDVRAMIGLQDGRMLIGGELQLRDAASLKRLLRLSPDGAVDAAFREGASGDQTFDRVEALAVGADGGVLVGGFHASNSGAFGVYRLLGDGALDPDFQNGLANFRIDFLVAVRLVVQPDGRILVLGTRNALGRVGWPGIVRLNVDGSVDRSFQPGTGATFAWPYHPPSPEFRQAGVLAAAVQSDGRIVIGGQFTHYQDAERAGITRLLADGSLDASFNEGAGISRNEPPHGPPYAMVRALALAGDGGILGGGNFDSAGGRSAPRITWWSTDGSIPGFGMVGPFSSSGLTGGEIEMIAPQPDGSLLIGGNFSTTLGTGGIARLGKGTTRPDLLVNLAGVRSLVVQPGGRIVAAGSFAEVDGIPRRYLARVFGDSTAQRAVDFESLSYQAIEDQGHLTVTVVRKGASGEAFTVDVATRDDSAKAGTDYTAVATTLTFTPGESAKTVRIPILDNGRVEERRNFRVVLARPSTGIRLGAVSETWVTVRDDELSAAVDTGFDPDVNGSIRAILRQPDGRIVIGGEFTRVNGVSREAIARLEPDGTLDLGFGSPLHPTSECCTSVQALALQPDGRLVVGGYFQDGGSLKGPRDTLVRLLPDGSFDPSFIPPPMETILGPTLPARALAVDDGGRILVGNDETLIRLLPDGGRGWEFRAEPPLGGQVTEIQRLSDGKILAIGQFSELPGGHGRLARRLEATGSDDPTYRAADRDPVSGVTFYRALAIQPDGKVYVIGSRPTDTDPSHAVLMRLDEAGAVDPTFAFRFAGSQDDNWHQVISAVGATSDGRLIVAGEETDPLLGTTRGLLQAVGSEAGMLAFEAGPSGGRLSPILETILDDGPGRILVVGGRQVVLGDRGRYLARIRTDARDAMACEFARREYRFGEREGTARIEVRRVGDIRGAASVRITTHPVTAVAGRDFTVINRVVTFAPFQTDATVEVPIVDHSEWGPDRTLELRLSEPGNGALLGRARATVIVQDEDRPDSIDFKSRSGILAPRSEEGGVPVVEAIRVLPDGGFHMWGSFAAVDREPRPGFAEFGTDGRLRPTGNTVPVPALAYAPDGSRYGQNGHRFVRFREDGSVDPGFQVVLSPAYTVSAVAVLPDQRVVIGGSFDRVNGQPRSGLARLLPDGSLDLTFSAGAGISGAYDVTIRALALQPDGRLVVGGHFESIHGQFRSALARLEADGALETGFASGLSLEFSASVWAVAVEPAGSVLALGVFPVLVPNPGDGDRGSLIRLNETGSQVTLVASTRDTELGSPWCLSCPGEFYSLGVLPDGGILLGGGFTSYQGVPRTSWVRLHGAPLPQPRIEQARIEAGIEFSGVIRGKTGWTYQIESSADLWHWIPVKEMVSHGVQTKFTVPLTDASTHHFFRILTK